MTKLRIGLVGAGAWAQSFHAPMFANQEETDLVAVWARRSQSAEELAQKFGTTSVSSFEELLDQCEAVVLAVPPDIQAPYASLAAKAGKALLLEKPLGLDLDQAQRLADDINEAGVINLVTLTNRFSPTVREFVSRSRQRKPLGAIGTFINGSCLPGGFFAAPWRKEAGALLDLGPHVVDLLDATAGPIVDIKGQGDPTKFFTFQARHESGAQSIGSLSLVAPVRRDVAGVHLFTDEGELSVAFSGIDGDPEILRIIRDDLVNAVKNNLPHVIDVNRALHVQRLLEQAAKP
ncbi:Gfo/Idh/MocA family protein [[Micrococcus luteus] ATCC 49442]|uniref:Gfo/Idh/MocA family protein n=1 Tax=[Micrococcus luteus] ATCC 49442 TaxID=2698727 RepID=UPI0013DB488E|nr:Gfo/Idh/MocA family oxidoreductase [[Micrococcus luteus] ATCC 49442]